MNHPIPIKPLNPVSQNLVAACAGSIKSASRKSNHQLIWTALMFRCPILCFVCEEWGYHHSARRPSPCIVLIPLFENKANGTRTLGCCAVYQGSGPSFENDLPVGPSSSGSAKRVASTAPISTGCVPVLPFRSVFVNPGFAEFILIVVPRSSCARWTVSIFRAAFEAQ
jgi:hypothetical protein